MVDTKEELESIGDYKPSGGGGDSSPPPKKEESTPSPPPPPSKKQDKSEPTPSKPGHATPSPPSGGNRIFATPAARKFAEEKKVIIRNSFLVCGVSVNPCYFWPFCA